MISRHMATCVVRAAKLSLQACSQLHEQTSPGQQPAPTWQLLWYLLISVPLTGCRGDTLPRLAST
jgi:hypothetical protein